MVCSWNPNDGGASVRVVVGNEMIRERHSGCLHPAKSTKKTNKTKENKLKVK
jgi:hypothetical protein